MDQISPLALLGGAMFASIFLTGCRVQLGIVSNRNPAELFEGSEFFIQRAELRSALRKRRGRVCPGRRYNV